MPRSLIVALAVVALLVVVRLVLDPIAAWATRRKLAELEGFRATFSDVHVALLPPGVSIDRFKLIESAGRWDEPLLYFERAKVGVHWRKLLDGQLVARVAIDRPKIVVARRHEEKVEKSIALSRQLESIAPIEIDRLEVNHGEALIAEGKGKNAPQIWLHALDLNAVNLATRKALMQGDPASIHLTGKVQRSGELAVDARFDPWALKPTFTATAKLERLDARELHGYLEHESDLHVKKGRINLYAELEAKSGQLEGGVKPVLENIEIATSKPGLGKRFKAFLADAAIELFTDDIPGRDAVATVIPIRGSLDQPDVQLLPTVLGAVRNAFVVGLESGFSRLPLPTADKEQGVVKQVVQALKADQGPAAQPDGDEKEEAKPGRKKPR